MKQQYVYYVLADDCDTDTTIIASSAQEVRDLMRKNHYWKRQNLRPKLIQRRAKVQP